MNAQLRALVAQEFEAIPLGGRDQSISLMAYEQARLNGPGSRPEVVATWEAAHEVALRAVREHQPDFVPVLVG